MTPAKVSFLTLILNIIFNAILMFPMKIAGLALATSISGIISFAVLFSVLEKRLRPFNVGVIAGSFLRISLASLGMALTCYFVYAKISVSAPCAAWVKFVSLGIAILAGMASYAFFCFIFRVSEIRQVWKWVLRKK